MTDNKDSTPVATEIEGTPTTQVSDQQAVQPSSEGQSTDFVSAFLSALESKDERLVEGLSRFVQSDKDRGVNRARETAQAALQKTETLSDELARLSKFLPNVTAEQLEQAKQKAEDADLMDYVRKLKQGKVDVSDQQSQGSDKPDLSGMVKGILLARGIPENDPGVSQFVNNYNGTNVAGDLLAYLENRPKPSASAATVSAPSGSSPPTGKYDNISDDELGAKLFMLNRTDPRGTAAERKEIQAELTRRDNKKK